MHNNKTYKYPKYKIDNRYGWFEKVAYGTFALKPDSHTALQKYATLMQELKAEREAQLQKEILPEESLDQIQ